MALAQRFQRGTANIWPGFVDALATLLMVIIFLLMIFVVAQFHLNDALLGRDEALERLNRQVSDLAEMLSLEREANASLRSNVAQMSGELQSSLADRDDLTARLNQLLGVRSQLEAAELALQTAEAERQAAIDQRQALTTELSEIYRRLEDASKIISADKETIEAQLAKLAALQQDIVALQALRDELRAEAEGLESQLAAAAAETQAREEALSEEKQVSLEAKAQVALLNRQISALRQEIAQLNAALEASELKDEEQKAQIANLGERLNKALASKVQELARYRSEFFGRLREVLGDRQDIQIVGDRFVFQSEVLFPSGSADMQPGGQVRLAQFAQTLREIARKIPSDIDWILRVDGHTDRVPISTTRFPTNWELSTARAISVVKFLADQGIPERRLVAAGFGEFQPLDVRDDEIAYRRNRRIEMKLDQR